MDDVKLYAKNERDIDSLIHLTRLYSEDIGMSFGLEECGRMIARRGTVVTHSCMGTMTSRQERTRSRPSTHTPYQSSDILSA